MSKSQPETTKDPGFQNAETTRHLTDIQPMFSLPEQQNDADG